MKKDYNDRELIWLYSLWSEDYWCAGFIMPDSSMVKQFRQWLNGLEEGLLFDSKPIENYEQEMLDEFRLQEEAARGGEANS